MNRRFLLVLGPLLALLAWSGTAEAQNTNAKVVASCGGAGYTAGVTSQLTQDTTGTLCSEAGGGGGGGNVNLTGINGVAPAVGNGTTNTGTLRVTISSDSTGQVALAAGSAVIGHVITDSGSTTAVTQATASSLNATVVGTGTFATQSVVTQGTASNLHALVTTNADGSASGGTAATVSILGGGIYNSSPITLTNGQQAATQLDSSGFLNVHVQAGGGSGGTSSNFGSAFPSVGTAAGFSDGTDMQAALVDASKHIITVGAGTAGSASGGVFSIQGVASGTVVGTNLAQVNGNTTATSGTGVQKVGIVGSGNTTMDASINAGSAPSNGLAVIGQFLTAPPTPSNGQSVIFQVDGHSNLRIVNMDAAGNARGANVDAGNSLQVAGEGTAGSAAGGVVTIQGVASMTPILATVTATNLSTNLAQVNGVTVLTGTGAVGTGAQRIAVGTDTATIAGSAPGTAGSASANVVTVQGVASMTPVLATVTPATGTFSGCAGATEANTLTALVNQTTNTQVVTGTASQKIRICAINLVTATAQNVAVIEGSGSTCGSSPLGLLSGGATAATGWNWVANEGLTEGNGQGVLARTTVNANNVCVFQSSTGQVSGTITYVSF